MTKAVLKFMEMVPSHLRNISKQLETLNMNISSLTGTLAQNKPNENKDEEIFPKDYLIKETIVMLAVDLYKTIYDKKGNFADTAKEIIDLAEEFETQLQWRTDGTEDRDFIEKLEKFEEKVSKRYRKIRGEGIQKRH